MVLYRDNIQNLGRYNDDDFIRSIFSHEIGYSISMSHVVGGQEDEHPCDYDSNDSVIKSGGCTAQHVKIYDKNHLKERWLP